MDGISYEGLIPDSILPYPKGLWNKVKYVFWKGITPIFIDCQRALLALHIIHHEGRQPFMLGRLLDEKNVEDFVLYLHKHGYGNHFIAWKDTDEIVSVRKIESFERQYHLRIFSNREVRGHYEYTPESHGRWHMKRYGQEPRREDFMALIKDWIVPME